MRYEWSNMEKASAQSTGKLRVSIKENGSTWEGKNEIRSDQRNAISIKELLVWERKRWPPPIYCRDSAGSDQRRTSTSRGFDIKLPIPRWTVFLDKYWSDSHRRPRTLCRKEIKHSLENIFSLIKIHSMWWERWMIEHGRRKCAVDGKLCLSRET